MAKTEPKKRSDAAVQGGEVSDEVVNQVGKAAAQILRLRQSFEEHMAVAETDDDRQKLADQVETAAVVAISDQGLTVDQYNEVISAAQDDAALEERVLIACRAA